MFLQEKYNLQLHQLFSDLTSIAFALQMTSKNIGLNGRGKQECVFPLVLVQHVKNPLLVTEKKRENDGYLLIQIRKD